MKTVYTSDIIEMSSNGVYMIIQGCDEGDLQSCIYLINKRLLEDEIIENRLDKVYKYKSDNGNINLIFAIDGSSVDIGKLAMWRLANRQRFGVMWLDDYVSNYIQTEYDEEDDF